MLASRCAAISYPTLKYISCGSGPSPTWSRALSLFACRASWNLSIASSLALIHDTLLAHQSLRLSWLLLRGPIHVEFTCKKFFVSRKQKDIGSKWKRLINAVNFTGKKLKIVLINIFIDINVILHEILFAKMEFYR